MPVWGAVALAISVALITQFGAFIVQHKQRKHDRERRRNEEWHRNLRWAVDLISKGNEASELLGINALDALDDDKHLSTEDQRLIDAILTSILGEPGENYDDNGGQVGYTDQNERDGGDSELSTRRRATAGQVAAAKLLVKREREGKATVAVSPRIRRIADQGKPTKVA